MKDAIKGGAGKREGRSDDNGRQRRIESRCLGKRGNGEGGRDHDRRMGDIDDIEQPERDREPGSGECVECAE